MPSAVNVTVNAGSVLRTLDNRHFGINTAVWDSVLPDTVSINLMKEAGIKALRFPGGSMSDDYDWQTGKTGTTTWATTFDEFASVAPAINAPRGLHHRQLRLGHARRRPPPGSSMPTSPRAMALSTGKSATRTTAPGKMTSTPARMTR